MKRNSVINLLILIAFSVALGVFFVSFNAPDEPVYTAPVVVPVVPATPDWIDMTVTGKSMEPWIPFGSAIRVYPADAPAVGDAVAFDCLVKKCLSASSVTSNLKFLRAIDARGCYYFVGREDRYFYEGEWTYSFDSTEYGYLCSGEFKVLGVVRDLPSEEGKR